MKPSDSAADRKKMSPRRQIVNYWPARFDEKRFRFLATETPGFALSAMRTMAERLSGADRVIEADDEA
jgi:hypothetical protein